MGGMRKGGRTPIVYWTKQPNHIPDRENRIGGDLLGLGVTASLWTLDVATTSRTGRNGSVVLGSIHQVGDAATISAHPVEH